MVLWGYNMDKFGIVFSDLVSQLVEDCWFEGLLYIEAISFILLHNILLIKLS